VVERVGVQDVPRRLRDEERVAVRRADLWIAAVDALVVLALSATLLLIAILHGFAGEHATLADRGFPVMALWAGIQIVAVVLAELTGRIVFWWLEPHQPGERPRLRT
jgi:sterol desaturase/sphingolipid hydroxylase (fatty acid hydroxylase superfamily)